MSFNSSSFVRNGRATKVLVGVFTLSFMLSMTVQPLVFSTFSVAHAEGASISINKITDGLGNVYTAEAGFPTFDCDTNPLYYPVTVEGSGSGDPPPGKVNQYDVAVFWGVTLFDPVSNTIPDRDDKDPFDFTFSHTISSGPTDDPIDVTAHLYHENINGNDNNAADTEPLSICVFNEPPVNSVPVAANDSYSTNEDVALVVAASGVLANDTDSDLDPLTASLVTNASDGSVTLNPDGSFTYTPNNGFEGSDSFTYKANDGDDDSNTATVSIDVEHVNHAPSATGESYSTNEDVALTESAPGVLSNDSDPDSDAITAVLDTGPANGILSLNSNGGFTYTPNSNFNGSDSFTYAAYDGGLNSNVVTVNITVNPVNDAPVANNDSYSTDEDTQLFVGGSGVLGNDTDVEGNPLTAVLVGGPSNGTLNFNSDGSFDYMPNADFNGSDSFTYKANDGSADSNVATVNITVSNVNDVPVANADSYSVDEDSSLLPDASEGVLDNDSDVDGNPLTAIVVDDVDHGTLTLNPDGSFLYVPTPNYNGPDSFTYKANDGSADSSVAVVTITVNPVNDAPVAVADTYSTNEDTQLDVLPSGVILNDSDIDGDTLEAVLVSNVSSGTLTLNDDGSFTYMPNADFNGPDSFTYKANDSDEDSNTVTVTINVGSVPDSQCDDDLDNDDDDNTDFEDGSGCTGPHDPWEEENPPVSTFADGRDHQIITTELVSMVLSGSSVDDESGFGSAEMIIYRLADEATMLGEGFFGQTNDEVISPFEALTCSPVPQNAVEIELVALSLTSVAPLTSDWSHDWTIPGKGVYCAVVHATDAAGNVEHTGITGPFAYNPTPTPSPTTTPPPTGCQSNCGGGGGGGGFPATPTPTPSVAPAPTATPEVLGITTLPATSTTSATNIAISLFSAMMMTGVVMLMIGLGVAPKRLEAYLK